MLKNKRDIALGGTPVGDILAVDEHLSLGRLFEAGDDAQRGGLAGAGLAQKHEELAVGDVEVEIAKRGGRTVFLGDVLEFDMGHLNRLVPKSEVWRVPRRQRATPSDRPSSVLKKCACAGSIRAHNFSPGFPT